MKQTIKKMISCITAIACVGAGIVLPNVQEILPEMSVVAMADDMTYGDLKYQIFDDVDGTKGIIITHCSNEVSLVEIPLEIDGILVTNIGDFAFQDCINLTNITIPDGVMYIEDYAFRRCTGLINVEIPNSVISIGDSAFCNCENLVNISLPNSITTIKDCAFEGCDSLTNITIPDSIKVINRSVFEGCDSLTDIYIPDNVTIIGERAFHGCKGLTDIIIPDSIVSIGIGAFSKTPFLENQTTDIKYVGKWVVTCNEEAADVEIATGTIGIAKNAFAGNINLVNITIPDSVMYIDDFAFLCCENLIDIKISNNVKNIGFGAFSGCISLKNITIPDSVTNIESCSFSFCTNLKSVTISNSVTNIEEAAFKYCENLTDVYYKGTEEQWNQINIDNGNECLNNAKIHFNYKDATGDINGDGDFTVSDVVSVQKWLLGSEEITDWKAGDFDRNDKLNIFDICIMKHKLLNK